MEEVVVIVGAGPAGLAASVCLSQLSIPNVILEREDCAASLWKRRAYDRLHLHLAKQFCELPFMPHPAKAATFMAKDDFIEYLDSYVSHFNMNPRYNRFVESASFNETEQKWRIEARSSVSGEVEVYVSKFLVIATGENGEAFIPKIQGLDSFGGEAIHSSCYKSGSKYEGKDVLVIGCGNSGMEISYDLTTFGARTSIVIRSPFHFLSKEMIYFGMQSMKVLPMQVVDEMLNHLAQLAYGDLSNYGLIRPSDGPFHHKVLTGKTPVIDVGTVQMIRSGEIRVVPAIVKVNGNAVEFEDGTCQQFDAIVFATGYKSVATKWLKDFKYILNEEGMPKAPFPNHWKGERGVYCVGLSRMGIHGISMDAMNVAKEISQVIATHGIGPQPEASIMMMSSPALVGQE